MYKLVGNIHWSKGRGDGKGSGSGTNPRLWSYGEGGRR